MRVDQHLYLIHCTDLVYGKKKKIDTMGRPTAVKYTVLTLSKAATESILIGYKICRPNKTKSVNYTKKTDQTIPNTSLRQFPWQEQNLYIIKL